MIVTISSLLTVSLPLERNVLCMNYLGILLHFTKCNYVNLYNNFLAVLKPNELCKFSFKHVHSKFKRYSAEVAYNIPQHCPFFLHFVIFIYVLYFSN